MHCEKKTFACIFILLVQVILYKEHCVAQKFIKLKDISKLVLEERAGGLGNNYKRFEVVKEGRSWKCYQTISISYTEIDTSTKRKIKNIPANVLTRLLAIVESSDSILHIKQFEINQKELVSNIDSLKVFDKRVKFSAKQKSEFADSLNSKFVIQPAFQKVMKPVYLDDRTYYGIKIITGLKDTSTVYAYSFADLYYLPWIINNRKIYNPKITLIYEFIKDNKTFPVREKHYLYTRIVQNIYWKYFQRKFN